MKILSVIEKNIQPKDYGSWNSNMQVIETDEGIYIDNLVGKSFGQFPCGYNWSQHIEGSESIDHLNIKIRTSRGYKWLNMG